MGCFEKPNSGWGKTFVKLYNLNFFISTFKKWRKEIPGKYSLMKNDGIKLSFNFN